MPDTLAPRAIIGVMTPAMDTVVQPELESLRPAGVTNQMQRFRLGGDRISEDFIGEAERLMDCHPRSIAVGLTTDAGPGGVARLADLCNELEKKLGIPVCNASIATQQGLRTLGAQRVAVLTPFNDEVNEVVQGNIEAGGFEVVAIDGTKAPSLPAICETPVETLWDLTQRLAESDCDAIAQVGTALPMAALVEELEEKTGKPIVACNIAVYRDALRAAGISDAVSGFGRLMRQP